MKLLMKWTGDSLVPLNDSAKREAQGLTEGKRYAVEVEVADRSAASHRHYFATLKDIWDSLPDAVVMDMPTVEHMRKRALIETGWCTMKDVTCTTHMMAVQVAAVIKSVADPYVIIVVRDDVVRVYEAMSQSVKSMGKKDFQRSKDDVLNWCEGLLERGK